MLFKKEEVSQELIEELAVDRRTGVRNMLENWRKKQLSLANERKRLDALYHYERTLGEQGHNLIAGIDEAGRGPLAGPVVVAAVILPIGFFLPWLNDSKQLSAKQRDELYYAIKEAAIAVSHVVVNADEIDRVNIFQATVAGMYQTIENLKPQPNAVLVDAVRLPRLPVTSLALVGGDAISASIAAASIIAKVERDRIMEEYDKQYSEYGFAKHKGYATKSHLAALAKYGPCPIHRRSFAPIKSGEGGLFSED